MVAIVFDTNTTTGCTVTIYTVLPPGNPITDAPFFNAFRSWGLSTEPAPHVVVFGPDIDSHRQEYLTSVGVTYVPFLVDYKEVVYNSKILKYLQNHAPYNTSDVFLFTNPYAVLRPAETAAAIHAFCTVALPRTVPTSERCQRNDAQAVMYAPAILGDVGQRLSFGGDWEASLPLVTSAAAGRTRRAPTGASAGRTSTDDLAGGGVAADDPRALLPAAFVDDIGLLYRHRWGDTEADVAMPPAARAIAVKARRDVWLPIANASYIAFSRCSAVFAMSTASVAAAASVSNVFRNLPARTPIMRISTPVALNVPPSLQGWAARSNIVPVYLPWPGGAVGHVVPQLSVTLSAAAPIAAAAAGGGAVGSADDGSELSSAQRRAWWVGVLFGRRGWERGSAVTATVEPMADYTMRVTTML